MIDNLKSWCFLVSRNPYLDYRTVVAPNFICEAGIGNILARVTEGDITEQGTAFYREILYSKAAEFTIIYRIIEATAENTGIDGNGCLKDSVGREISLIEGLVFQGLLPNIVVTEQNLEAAHQQVISYYREFWESLTRISIFPSELIEYIEPSGQSLNLIKLTAYVAGEKQQLSLPQKGTLELNYGSWKIIDKNIDEKIYNNEEVASLAVFPDSETFAARYDCDIVVWKISEKEPISKFSGTRKPLGGFLTPIVVNSTGELIATAMIEGFDENKIKLYNLKTNDCKDLGTQGQFKRVKAVVFSPDSKIVFSASGEKIKLWDAECEGIERGELSDHSDDVRCLAVDSNKGLLASGDRRGYIKLWKISNKKAILTIQPDQFPINSLAFSPDGQFLVSGSDGGAIKVWNVKTEKEYPVDWKQSQPINCVAFSPNGSLIATGCDNTIIKIWDLKNPQSSPICRLKEHDKAVTAVVFTPDGKKLISGSKDGTVRVWRPVQ